MYGRSVAGRTILNSSTLTVSYQRSLSVNKTKESKLLSTTGKMIWCPTTKPIIVKDTTAIVTPKRKVQCSIQRLQKLLFQSIRQPKARLELLCRLFQGIPRESVANRLYTMPKKSSVAEIFSAGWESRV